TALTDSRKYEARWGAVETLSKLKKVSRADYVNAYVADLQSDECALKRRAVERLGNIGDKQALSPIEVAAKADKAKKHWYWFSCLGDRPQHAEKEILARAHVSVGT